MMSRFNQNFRIETAPRGGPNRDSTVKASNLAILSPGG